MSAGGAEMISIVKPDQFEPVLIEQQFSNGRVARAVVLPPGGTLAGNRADELVNYAGMGKYKYATPIVPAAKTARGSQNPASELRIGFSTRLAEGRIILIAVAPQLGVMLLDLNERESIEKAAVDFSQGLQDSGLKLVRRRCCFPRAPKWAGVDG
jgi:hypothetical protein